MEEITILDPPLTEEELDPHQLCRARQERTEVDLAEVRSRMSSIMSRFETFKSEVKRVAIEQMREGRWCHQGMNEKLEELGIEPYAPRYVVSMTVDLLLEVYADDESDAEDTAKQDLRITSEDENYLDVSEIRVRAVEEMEE